MAISTRWSRSPVTRPDQSPSIIARPSSSRSSSAKNELAASSDSTTMPTLSIRGAPRGHSCRSQRSGRLLAEFVQNVVDAIGGTSVEAQGGGQPIGWVALACELQRAWNRQETVADIVQIVITER